MKQNIHWCVCLLVCVHAFSFLLLENRRVPKAGRWRSRVGNAAHLVYRYVGLGTARAPAIERMPFDPESKVCEPHQRTPPRQITYRVHQRSIELLPLSHVTGNAGYCGRAVRPAASTSKDLRCTACDGRCPANRVDDEVCSTPDYIP